MRLKTVRIENIRGIKGLELDLGGRNYAVSGPNGCGKSAVVDAVDFLLTGEIARLQGRGTGDVRILEHGKHIDCDEPEKAKVRAVLLTDGGDEVEVERTFADRTDLSVSDSAHASGVNELVKAAQQGFHVLTRGDILDFIFATPGERGEKVESLLRLTDVDPVRRSLNRTADQLESSAETARSNVNRYTSNVRELVGAEEKPLVVAVKRLEDCRRYLGAESTIDLELDEVNFRESLTSPVGSLPESPLRSELTREKLNSLRDWYEEERQDLIEDLTSFLEDVGNLQEDDQAVRELRTGELISIGLETLREDDEQCPLCLTAWEYDELEQLLRERREKLRSAEELRTRLESTKSELLEKLTRLSAVVDSVKEACEQEEGLVQEPIASLEDGVSDLDGLLTSPILGISKPHEEARSLPELFALPRLPTWIQDVEERIAQLSDYEPLEELWEILRDASRLYNKLREHWRREAEFSKAATNARSIAQDFGSARREVLDNVYDSVAGTVKGYYETIHAPDESDFAVELDPKETGLDLRVPFYDRGMHPPHALHSEGHQDTMGLCLFLALHSELAGRAMGFTILDDVVSSVDASHRRGVVELLGKQSDSLQLFLTTHDDVFLNHLRSEGVIRRREARRFSGWDIEVGPHDSFSLSDSWSRIEALLDDGDVSGAAARLRRTGEWFLREAAGRLGASVRYKPDHRWSLGDFSIPLLGRLRELTKEANRAVSSWGRDTTKIDAFDEERKAVYGDWYRESGAVNKNVHYREDEWATFSPEELRRVVQAYRSLYELLKCSQCGSFVRVIYDEHTPAQVVCRCRESFDWSLEHKS